MLTEGLRQGEYSEVTLPGGDICRIYKEDGRVECKAPGEKEFTPRGEQQPAGGEFPPLNITL